MPVGGRALADERWTAGRNACPTRARRRSPLPQMQAVPYFMDGRQECLPPPCFGLHPDYPRDVQEDEPGGREAA